MTVVAEPLAADRRTGNYPKLCTAAGASNLADGIFQVALPLLVLRLTRSPGAVGGLVVAARLPWLLCSLHAGVLADRLDRRVTMVRVDVARVVLIGGLAALTVAGHERLWVLYVVAVALGTAETLFDTSAQALMPSVVAAEDLTRANGRLYAIEVMMNQFAGPPLGGMLVAVGITLAFTASAAGYALAAFALVTMVGSFRPVRSHEGSVRASMRGEIVEGLRYLWGHRLLRTFTVVGGVSNLFTMAAFALFPLLVVRPGPLGLSEFGYGLLLTVAAVGSLLGSLIVARVEARLGRRRMLVGCLVVDGAATAALATGRLAVAIPVGLVLGVTLVFFNVVAVSLRQRITPNHLLGRINAAHRMVTWGTMPAGAAVGAVLAEAFGVRAVFLVSGVAMATLVVLLRGVTDAAMADAERAIEGDGG
ncbi:MAG: MFS transporter [Acidimicrobiales bacterium]